MAGSMKKWWKSRGNGREECSERKYYWYLILFRLIQQTSQLLSKMNTEIPAFFGSMTSLIQPLDVSLNKHFKDRLIKLWNDWVACDDIQLTKSGNFKKSGHSHCNRMDLNSWKTVSSDIWLLGLFKNAASEILWMEVKTHYWTFLGSLVPQKTKIETMIFFLFLLYIETKLRLFWNSMNCFLSMIIVQKFIVNIFLSLWNINM